MKVIIIFGTRPEAIKLAPVIQKLKAENSRLKTITCVTAQHREMLDQVLKIFGIKPDYDLNIMRNNQTLFDISINALLEVEKVLKGERPSLLLVQGDTTTTFIASLAAFYLKIPIGHIEAGLRTNNKYQPFPEESNRRLTTHIADLHFAPTETAKNNLIIEGIKEDKIFVTGNTVIDALLTVVRDQKSVVRQKALDKYFSEKWNLSLTSNNRKLILITGHRRENFGEGLKNICYALKEITLNNPDIQIVYPVHLNPNVQEPISKILNGVKNIYLIEPLDYSSFVYLMSNSYLILTDSGGIQEEAPSLGKPVLVMRDVTERPEAVKGGTAKLVGSNKESIVKETQLLLDSKREYEKIIKAINPYGDGRASERIVEIIKRTIWNKQ